MSLAPNTINVGSFNSLPEAPPRLGRKSALVVDDSSTILHMICTLLEHHKVVEVVGRAENGLEAIDAVASLNPEIVLIDAELPEMSGLRTALVLSQMCPATKVVLMTMDPSSQFREACAGCGAHAVIYKPRFLKELSAVLRNNPAPHKPVA
ncbi:MAG: response regulator [Acidobacteriia bacterium]|nr:response regulator [Terriglobia bacterium]